MLEARKEQVLPPSRPGRGVTSLMLGVLGRRKGRELKGFLSLLCDGEAGADLLGDLMSSDTGESGVRARSVTEGEEDRELELDREIVSVQRANLAIILSLFLIYS